MPGGREDWRALESEAKANPQDPHRWLALAESLVVGGEPKKARQVLEEQRDHLKGSAEVAARLSFVWEQVDDLSEAIAAARQGLKLAPHNPRAHARIATLLANQGDTAAAHIRWMAALNLFPQDAQLRLQYAESLADANRFDEALEQAAQADEKSTRAYVTLARIHGALGNDSQRILALRSALSAPDRDQRATLELARALADTGAFTESMALLDQAAHDLSEFEYGLEIGRTFARFGAGDRARATLERLAEYNPERYEVWLELGRLHIESGRPEDAKIALETAQGLSNAPEIAWELGLAYRACGQSREAAGALIRAAAARPNDEHIQEILSDTLQKLRTPTNDLAQSQQHSGFSGDLSVFAIPELLEFLVHQRASGELSVRNDSNAWVVIELDKGNIVGARGSHMSGLRSWVMERHPRLTTRLSTRGAFDGQSTDRETAATMLRLGVSQVLLQSTLEERCLLTLEHLRSWFDGRLRFDRTQAEHDRPVVLVEARWAMMEVLRIADEQNAHQ